LKFRKIQVRKKLKAAWKKGVVSEGDFAFEFSSSDEDGEEEVCIEDDFVLPKKTWKKLYRSVCFYYNLPLILMSKFTVCMTQNAPGILRFYLLK